MSFKLYVTKNMYHHSVVLSLITGMVMLFKFIISVLGCFSSTNNVYYVFYYIECLTCDRRCILDRSLLVTLIRTTLACAFLMLLLPF